LREFRVNRWAQTVVAGTGFGGANTFDSATNRITTASFAHDGSGNLTANGPATSYTHDQENRMVSAAAGSVSYAMDAQGRRNSGFCSKESSRRLRVRCGSLSFCAGLRSC
jgi:hypothetical protein